LDQEGQVVVAARGLGCIATTHLPAEAVAKIQGALLVAPADPERRGILADFAPVPYQPLPYGAFWLPVATTRIAQFARQAPMHAHGVASCVRLHNAGHINVEAGSEPWPLGLALLQSLSGTPQSDLFQRGRSLFRCWIEYVNNKQFVVDLKQSAQNPTSASRRESAPHLTGHDHEFPTDGPRIALAATCAHR